MSEADEKDKDKDWRPPPVDESNDFSSYMFCAMPSSSFETEDSPVRIIIRR